VRRTSETRGRDARGGWSRCAAAGACLLWAAGPQPAAAKTVEELARLSIEELARIEITSVSKRPEPLSRAPAAVYVITAEDIRRSGAYSLPEILRLAPNLTVARQSALNYAISARGFNSVESSIKMLVLIDGRSIYTPLFGGVIWDQHHVLPEDIERIEVISGPGGTLWGANAFNGVINIVTKSARDTQGALGSVQLGDLDSSAAGRYGGAFGRDGAWRAYATAFERGEMVRPDGTGADDDWRGRQAGFRADWAAGANAFTLQGDLFENALRPGDAVGGNLLGRWGRQLEDGSRIELQAYVDAVERDIPRVSDALYIFDVEGRHDVRLGDRHEVVWGGGYRVFEDEFVNTLNAFTLDPEKDVVQLGNVFAQDSIALRSDLSLTLGLKLEYSSYTGLEHLPSARLAYDLSDRWLLWSAVSRAVRTPARFDRDLGAAGVLERARNFRSEELIAYEAGVRGQPTAETSLSVSFFYNDYDDLRVLAISPASGLLMFANKMEGQIYGVEAWGEWRVLDWWRLSAGANLQRKNLDLEAGAVTIALAQHAGDDPEYQASLRSSMDLTEALRLDVALRMVDDLPSPRVPRYVELDARLGWQATEAVELTLAGFNLLDDHHPETGVLATRTEVPRSFYVGARVRF
jgi:iron complex outermembrane recepter protein